MDDPRRVPETFAGLAPAPAAACTRCGTPTAAFANGRGRLDICMTCGTLDLVDAAGLGLLHMKMEDLRLPGAEVERKRSDELDVWRLPPPPGQKTWWRWG